MNSAFAGFFLFLGQEYYQVVCSIQEGITEARVNSLDGSGHVMIRVFLFPFNPFLILDKLDLKSVPVQSKYQSF